MKLGWNIAGLISLFSGIAATFAGLLWIPLYDYVKLSFTLFDRYTQFQTITIVFVALLSATLILMGLGYLGFNSDLGIFGAFLGVAGGLIIIAVYLIYSVQQLILIPVLNLGFPLLIIVNNIGGTCIYFIIYVTIIILAIMGIILATLNKETTTPKLAIVGGLLLASSVATVFVSYYIVILFGALPMVAYSLYKLETKPIPKRL